jgi:hypothetical protein
MKTLSFRLCVLPLLAVALHAESELCVMVRDPSARGAASFVTIGPRRGGGFVRHHSGDGACVIGVSGNTSFG